MSDSASIAPTMVDTESDLDSSPGEISGFSASLEGAEIGGFEVLQRLGHGGMSVVYAATPDPRGPHAGHARVALKLVRTPSAMNLGALRREIHGLRRLEADGVVPVIASGVHEGRPWFAMPLLEGPTLRLRLRELWAQAMTGPPPTPDLQAGEGAAPEAITNEQRPQRAAGPNSGPGSAPGSQSLPTDLGAGASSASPATDQGEGLLSAPTFPSGHPGYEGDRPPPEASRPVVAAGHLRAVLKIFKSLCETLAVVHGKGIVHGDLKPENVILQTSPGDPTGAGKPTLVDFGLMATFDAAQGRESLDGEYALAGTPGYMAPEQILQELVDARADLYALGCMLYEALTGRRPFGGAQGLDLVQRQLYESPAAPSVWAQGIAPELDALVLRLVARHPQSRVGHAEDAALVLTRLLGEVAPARTGGTHYLYRPTLAGRLDTLTELEGLLSQAEQGHAAAPLVLLTGRSGMGKTRLAIELMASAARRRVKVYQGECVPLGAGASEGSQLLPGESGRGPLQGAPLHPFRGLLRAVADHCVRQGASATQSVLGSSLPVLANYAPELRSVPAAAQQGEALGLSGEAAQRRVLRALVDVINAFALEEPFLLVLDDVQWADPLTYSFLQAVANNELQLRRTMIVGTARSESPRAEFLALRRLPNVAEFKLGPLDASAVASIVEDMLASESTPKAFTDYLARASEGNPYFVAEYLRSAVEDRLLQREITGEWVLDDRISSSSSGRLDALPLPESVEQLVLRRVKQLSAEAKAVLDAAAVLGVNVDHERIAAVLERAPETVLDPVAELMAHAVLQSGDGGRLHFSHQKVRELTYDDMLDTRRRELHRMAARGIEAGAPKGDQARLDPSVLPLLANHWHAAADRPRAYTALVRAGQAALNAYAPASAVGPFAKALSLLDSHPQEFELPSIERARLHRDYAWARYCSGDVAGFLDHSHRALTRLGQGTPNSGLGWAAAAFAGVARHFGSAIVPATWLVARREQRRARFKLAAETASALSWGYIYGNSPPRALGLSLIAANLSARAGSVGPRAIPYTMLGATMGSFGMERAAQRYFAVARKSALEVSEVGQAYVQRWIEGMHHFNFARWDEGETLVREVLARGEASGDAHAIINSLSILSIGAYHRGQLSRCDAYAKRARKLARENQYTVLETVGRCQVACGFIHRDEPERAIRLLADREDGDIESEGVMTLISRRSIQAGAMLRAGQLDAAVQAADAATALLQANPSGNMTSIMAHYWLCAVYLAQAEHRRARGESVTKAWARARLTKRWADRFARMYPIGLPIALRHEANMNRYMGDPRGAEHAHERAAQRAQQLGMREELRLARAGRNAPG